jgi:hypothetical protein
MKESGFYKKKRATKEYDVYEAAHYLTDSLVVKALNEVSAPLWPVLK